MERVAAGAPDGPLSSALQNWFAILAAVSDSAKALEADRPLDLMRSSWTAPGRGGRVPSSAVFVTVVPHFKMIQNPAAASKSQGDSTGLSATFSGSSYTVGPVVTPTTTSPEAEEHVALDPNVSANLVAVISDFSMPVAGVSGVNTTKFASSTDNGSLALARELTAAQGGIEWK